VSLSGSSKRQPDGYVDPIDEGPSVPRVEVKSHRKYPQQQSLGKFPGRRWKFNAAMSFGA
jgi:hypothetical protein